MQKTQNKIKQKHSKSCSKPKDRREPNEKKHWPKRNWGSSDKKFVQMQRRPAMSCLQDQYPDLASKSPLEIYKLFFDKEIEDLIIHHTVKYAREMHNDSGGSSIGAAELQSPQILIAMCMNY